MNVGFYSLMECVSQACGPFFNPPEMMIRIRGLITNSGSRSEVGSSATGLIVVHVIFDRGAICDVRLTAPLAK